MRRKNKQIWTNFISIIKSSNVHQFIINSSSSSSSSNYQIIMIIFVSCHLFFLVVNFTSPPIQLSPNQSTTVPARFRSQGTSSSQRSVHPIPPHERPPKRHYKNNRRWWKMMGEISVVVFPDFFEKGMEIWLISWGKFKKHIMARLFCWNVFRLYIQSGAPNDCYKWGVMGSLYTMAENKWVTGWHGNLIT